MIPCESYNKTVTGVLWLKVIMMVLYADSDY